MQNKAHWFFILVSHQPPYYNLLGGGGWGSGSSEADCEKIPTKKTPEGSHNTGQQSQAFAMFAFLKNVHRSTDHRV